MKWQRREWIFVEDSCHRIIVLLKIDMQQSSYASDIIIFRMQQYSFYIISFMQIHGIELIFRGL